MSRYGPRVNGKLAGRLELEPGDVVGGVDRLDLDPRVGLAPVVGRSHAVDRTLTRMRVTRPAVRGAARARRAGRARARARRRRARRATSGRRSSSASEPAGLALRRQPRVRRRGRDARRRRRGRADPAGLGRRVPAHRRAARRSSAVVARGRRPSAAGAIATFVGTTRAQSRGRDRRSTSTTRPTRAWPSR